MKFQGDRVSPVLDNFTCINAHGKSIVDFMLIHQENLNLVSKCEVMLVNELLHNYKLSKLNFRKLQSSRSLHAEYDFLPIHMYSIITKTTLAHHQSLKKIISLRKIYLKIVIIIM